MENKVPFSLDLYIKNPTWKLITKDNKELDSINICRDNNKIIINLFDKDGAIYNSCNSNGINIKTKTQYLYLVVPVKVGFINLYKYNREMCVGTKIYNTLEEAIFDSKYYSRTYIKTIQIEY